MYVVASDLEYCFFAFLLDDGVDFLGGLLHHLLYAGGMDAAVDYEFFQSYPCDLPSYGIEGRDYDGFRRVVYYKVYARGGLYGPDVAAFAADYAALHVVAGKAYHRDGALRNGVRRAALYGADDYVFSFLVRLILGLGLYVLDHYGRFVADILFEIP